MPDREPVAPSESEIGPNMQTVFDRGVHLLESGDYAVAQAAFELVLKKDTTDFKARVNLAACHLYLGSLETAEQILHGLVEEYPNDPQIHNNLGSCLFAQGKSEAAEPCFARATELDPNDADYWCNLGRSQLAQNNKMKQGQGLTNLQQALKINSSHADTHRTLAEHYYRQDRYDTAQQHADSFLAEHPNDPDMLLTRSLIANNLENPREAAAYAIQAIRLAPENPSSYYVLAFNWEKLHPKAQGAKALQITLLYITYCHLYYVANRAIDKETEDYLFQKYGVEIDHSQPAPTLEEIAEQVSLCKEQLLSTSGKKLGKK